MWFFSHPIYPRIPNRVMMHSSTNCARETGYPGVERSSRKSSGLGKKPRKEKAILMVFQARHGQSQILILVSVASCHPSHSQHQSVSECVCVGGGLKLLLCCYLGFLYWYGSRLLYYLMWSSDNLHDRDEKKSYAPCFGLYSSLGSSLK